MPFLVKLNWAKWKEGDVITGGDIAEYHGTETMPESDRKKLGCVVGEKIPEERIRQLVARGVLQGFGDDAVFIMPEPEVLLVEQRMRAVKEFNESLQPPTSRF